MKKKREWISRALLIFAAMLCLTGCMSNEPCDSCGHTPSKGYKNESTGKTEYYCQACSSDCAFCSKKATRHYTSGLGRIIFVCDDHYDYVMNH